MAEQVTQYALTTLQRVKDLLFDPNKYISLTGASLTMSSTDVTGITVPTAKEIFVGQVINGTGIPAGTTIAAIISPTEITLSQAATATNTGQTLLVTDQPSAFDLVLTRDINSVSDWIDQECGRPYGFAQQTFTNETYSAEPGQEVLILRNAPVISLSDFSWRAGTISNPVWTKFLTDQFELIDPETDPFTMAVFYPKAMIRVYGVMPSMMANMVRATYVAGYLISWANAGNRQLHTLPMDLTRTAENLVVRQYTRRQLAGKNSQALEGATTAWRNLVDQTDLDVLDHYRLTDRAWN